MGKAWYPISRDHDVIERGPEFLEQKGNILHVQPIMCSTLGVYIWYSPPTARQVTCYLCYFFLFWAFQYAHVQLRSFYQLSTFDTAYMRDSPCLHNFNFHVPEYASLGTRFRNNHICLSNHRSQGHPVYRTPIPGLISCTGKTKCECLVDIITLIFFHLLQVCQ